MAQDKAILEKKVSIDVANESVQLLLKKLEVLGEFTFAYSSNAFDIERKLSLKAKEQTIKKILDEVFKGQGIEYKEVKSKILLKQSAIKPNKESGTAFVVQVSDQTEKSIKENVSKNTEAAQKAKAPSEKGGNQVKKTINESTIDEIDLESDPLAAGLPGVVDNSQLTKQRLAVTGIEKLPSSDLTLNSSTDPDLVAKNFTRATSDVLYGQPRTKKTSVPKAKKEKAPKGEKSFSIYTAPTVGMGAVGDATGINIGGRIVYMIKPKIGLGLAGFAYQSAKAQDDVLAGEYRNAGGYGGLFVEYILNPENAIRVSFPLMVGGGAATYTQRSEFEPKVIEDLQTILVLEPGVEVEFNLVSFAKLAIGLNYRLTSNAQLNYISSGDVILAKDGLNGLNAGFTLKLGKF